MERAPDARVGVPAPRWRGLRRLDWGWWAVTVAAGLVVAYVALRPFSDGQGQVGPAYTALLISPCFIALALCVRASRQRRLPRRTRWAWRLVGAAVALQALGAGIWMVPGLVDPNSFSTVADVFFLAFPPVLLGGLLCFPLLRGGRRERTRLALDVVLVGTSASMISWYLVIGPLLNAGNPDRLGMMISIAYPVGDLLLVFGAVSLLLRGVAEVSRRPLRILLAAVSVQLLFDSTYAYSGLHGLAGLWVWLQPLWQLFMVLAAAAAQDQYRLAVRRPTHPDAAAEVRRPRASRMPYVAVALSYALLLFLSRDIAPYPMGGMILGAVVLTTAVLLRQLTVVHDNRVMALTDGLTGLANRVRLHARLASSLDSARRSGVRVGVLVIDLDGFKRVNDTLGHEAGDAILIGVARALGSVVRRTDTAARLGGDEFAVVVEGLANEATAVGVAERVREALGSPIVFRELLLDVRASIGITTSVPGDDVDEVLRRADLAMYAAKRAGGGFRVHTEQMDVNPEGDLRQALERDELVLFYQPIVDLGTGEPVALEALVRWQHPERGLLPPGEFLPVAEETGLIVALDAWVLEHACAQWTAWADTIPAARSMTLNVNISAQQVRRPDLVADVTRIVDRTGVDPRRLVLELTESASIDEADQTAAKVEALRGLGIRVAVDDFGTGYSALSYLRRLPIDILKIDRSFTKHIEDDHDAWVVCEALVRLGRALKLTVVAEGIESDTECRALRRMSCDFGQGFHFARPQDAVRTAAMLLSLGGAHRQERGAPVRR
jgi:diguanylate cyclase